MLARVESTQAASERIRKCCRSGWWMAMVTRAHCTAVVLESSPFSFTTITVARGKQAAALSRLKTSAADSSAGKKVGGASPPARTSSLEIAGVQLPV
jgi:hypothetical protein